MKTGLASNRRAGGNTLLVSLVTMLIIGLALVTYLQLGTNQNQLVVRSQVWNACMPVLEAGIEEALEHCSYNTSNLVSNGWSLAGNQVTRSNSIGDGFCVVNISTNPPFDIVSSGYYPMPGSASYVSRKVMVNTAWIQVFKAAMVSRTTIRMNGNTVRVDSYDSRDPLKSTFGQYDPAKAGDKADVACMSSKGGNFDIGNGDILGHAIVGAGGTVTTGPNGHVGSVAWFSSGKGGVQPGWLRTDLNISLPDVDPPFVAAPPPGSAGVVDGMNFDYILSNGNYLVPTLDKRTAVTGNAVIYVTGNIASQDLYVRSNATVKIYCGGTTASFSTIDNQTASSLMYFGLPNNTSLSLGSDWLGAVYAPSADFSISGNTQVSGSVTVNSITMKGSTGFHYDEALGATGVGHSFVVTSWKEL